MRHDTRLGRPAPQAGPASRSRRPYWPRASRRRRAQPAGFRGRVLPGADRRPEPLALHAASVAAGPPDRLVPLDELRAVLLHPATGARARNKVWAELVRRARSGSPAWVVGLAGVAMPGLRRAAATLSASYRGNPADLRAEILPGFLAAMRALDPNDLGRVPLASRLCWAAWRAGQALAHTDASLVSRVSLRSGRRWPRRPSWCSWLWTPASAP